MNKYLNKGLLVIGGGILQIEALKMCKKLGIKTYLLDRDNKCYSKPFASEFFEVDIRDFESCLQIAEQLKSKNLIHGVFTQGTDVEHVVAYIAENLNFAGLSFEAAMNCNNKLRCRNILFKNKIDFTPFVSATSEEDFINKIPSITFPCYVKPTNNSASRGITRVNNNDELLPAFNKALNSCFGDKEVIIESEIKGIEYSVDTVIVDGVLYPCGISDRIFLEKKNYAVQIGSRTPSLLPSSVQEGMYQLMQEAAKVLGVNNSAFKGDLVVTEHGEIRVIEFAGRTSGGFDSQYRKPLSFGINIIKVVIDLALGFKVDFRDIIPKWNKWSSTYSKITNSGIITKIENLEEILLLDGVVENFFILNVGDKVEEMIDCAKRFNYFILVADTYQDLLRLENLIEEKLIIKIN